ncbi:NUDIX domain-containing protein [Desertihabitans aurantiacus]|uniref:NUDIX domain-containing protein n=1 Tax=Desertihabitans aurantiacus TaxID=2282477 RepID=UPI001E4106BA|nr:NUDIX hydrolase [Desertihabitans aurantiacus]
MADQAVGWPVLRSDVLADGRVVTLVEDEVRTPDGSTITRQYLRHPGAVGVIALDEQDRVVLVRQYRHPARHRLLEPPAGLLDVAEEEWLVGARRELAEEALLAAEDWRVLVDQFVSPGSTEESVRIYLARGLRPVPRPDGFVVEGEEAHMDVVLAPLAELVAAVLAGRLQNPLLVAGVLATEVARRDGYDRLRPADAPWPARHQRP